ncbi:MAG: hypothetical protein WAN72_22505, partial [Candidatus Acidiferrales bacterium]
TPVASLAMRISAPAIALSSGSSTKPLIVAFGYCPDRQPAKTRLTIPKKTILRNHMSLLRRPNCVIFLWSTKEKTEMSHGAIIVNQTDDTKQAIN